MALDSAMSEDQARISQAASGQRARNVAPVKSPAAGTLALQKMLPTVLISHLQGGISNFAAGAIPKSTAGPVVVDILERALRLSISNHQQSRGMHELDPKFVLAQAWSKSRLGSACLRLNEGIQADPIDVTGIQFPGLPTYYVVTDGMHRTVAARLAGKLTIRADVQGCHICDPQA